MYGSVNVPGVTAHELTAAIEAFKAELFSGELAAPLATADGTALATAGGVEILAIRKLAGLTEADMNAALSAAASGMAAQVNDAETRAQEYAEQAAARALADARADRETAMAELDNAILAV